MFSRIEDIKAPTFAAGVPFTWESFGDYLAHIRSGPRPERGRARRPLGAALLRDGRRLAGARRDRRGDRRDVSAAGGGDGRGRDRSLDLVRRHRREHGARAEPLGRRAREDSRCARRWRRAGAACCRPCPTSSTSRSSSRTSPSSAGCLARLGRAVLARADRLEPGDATPGGARWRRSRRERDARRARVRAVDAAHLRPEHAALGDELPALRPADLEPVHEPADRASASPRSATPRTARRWSRKACASRRSSWRRRSARCSRSANQPLAGRSLLADRGRARPELARGDARRGARRRPADRVLHPRRDPRGPRVRGRDPVSPARAHRRVRRGRAHRAVLRRGRHLLPDRALRARAQEDEPRAGRAPAHRRAGARLEHRGARRDRGGEVRGPRRCSIPRRSRAGPSYSSATSRATRTATCATRRASRR